MDNSQINFTLERLGVLSGSCYSGGFWKKKSCSSSSSSSSSILKKGEATGKFCYYIQLPDPSRSDHASFESPMNMILGAGKGTTKIAIESLEPV